MFFNINYKITVINFASTISSHAVTHKEAPKEMCHLSKHVGKVMCVQVILKVLLRLGIVIQVTRLTFQGSSTLSTSLLLKFPRRFIKLQGYFLYSELASNKMPVN